MALHVCRMGESGIKYGGIQWWLRSSENRNGYCENSFIFASNAAGSREVSQQKHGGVTQ
ncbi:MAG: hypothetical protein OCU16_07250 [Candidatus Methanospirare jalkutatii]|nr:hypothetical protein [Candidatus Methanospirare jalkutatii]